MFTKYKNVLRAMVLTVPFAFLSYFVTGVVYLDRSDWKHSLSVLLVYAFINFLFFMSMLTRKIDHYRAIIFILIALTFPIEFVLKLYELRGHFMALNFSDVINGNTPFCHIVIPQTIIPLIFKKQIIFPGTMDGLYYSVGSMITLWVAVSLLLGKGWCSWVCFYGGWEDGCSRIAKKARLKLNPKLIWSSVAVLLLVIILTIEFATPIYCVWLCPFKACSEFFEIASPLIVFQTIIFSAIFLALVIILPFLTKKRVQCMTFCPFGAFQSLVDKVNPFEVRIDQKKCINCKKCIQQCPVMALSEKSIERGRTLFNCNKCGKCIDLCPVNALQYHIKLTPIGGMGATIARQVFLYFTYIIVAGMGSSFIIPAIERILLLITTGSILH